MTITPSPYPDKLHPALRESFVPADAPAREHFPKHYAVEATCVTSR